MTERHLNASEGARLHAVASQIRLQAIESQLSLGFTLCALAETEIRFRQHSVARKLLDKVRHAAQSISFHLDEPNHLPNNSATDLRQPLMQLETRLEEVELRLDKA